ncbi:MAG: alpha-glucan family phosphorylase [Myxococcota bacterium]|nr:alpha-glucan family phosphorylase [Myxococcota bacterium]
MLERLKTLAADFWWTGDPWANDVWQELDPWLWEDLAHNPIAMLEELDWESVSDTWKEKAERLLERYDAYQKKETLKDCPDIAYFCMEFGLHESFPMYSGGLGILAGDHVRSACDLKLKFIGVGLLFQHGYFAQYLHAGRQVSARPHYLHQKMPLTLVRDANGNAIKIQIPFRESVLHAQAWILRVGAVRLYLLDTNLPENDQEQRSLTQSLYGGDSKQRIAQEILVGIGGVRLLEAMGKKIDVYHMNEGHSAFLVLELWIRAMQQGASSKDAWAQVKEKCVFTTHTPVPAGHDRFYWGLVNEYLGAYRAQVGLPEGAFMDSGREDPKDLGSPMSMTVLALNGSRKANGVSKLHGEVSREMFSHLDHTISHITNGVHPTAWLAPELADLFDNHLPAWNENWENASFWKKTRKLPKDKLWEMRTVLRTKLIAEVRKRVGRDVLDENALTIGFARRFATYKRGALIFSDPDRLQAILESGAQLIFAGKAHPADIPGQNVLATVHRFSRDPRFRGRVVFVPNYDAHIGRLLTQGCDVWLNNPRRPREASGTSGQKAALNGNQNLSILDGWWPEGYDGKNGWAIGDTKDWTDLEAQDNFDVESLYSLLEEEIIPCFQNPTKWTKRMIHTIQTCGPVFNTHRMVRDYLNMLYINA